MRPRSGACAGRAVPVLTVHGLADLTNPYEGHADRGPEWVESVPEALAGWLARLLGASRVGQRLRSQVALGNALFAMNRGVPDGRFLAGAYWRRRGGLPADFPRGAQGVQASSLKRQDAGKIPMPADAFAAHASNLLAMPAGHTAGGWRP